MDTILNKVLKILNIIVFLILTASLVFIYSSDDLSNTKLISQTIFYSAIIFLAVLILIFPHQTVNANPFKTKRKVRSKTFLRIVSLLLIVLLSFKIVGLQKSHESKVNINKMIQKDLDSVFK